MEIGFVDYSKEERNQILSTLSLLDEHTALDELGIGVVRDFYSNLLFPGISTLQTRAKYFVLIPYLFQMNLPLIKSGRLKSGSELQRWVNLESDKLVAVLVKYSPAGSTGIIGSRLLGQNKTVKQKVTSIYWSGLRALGIVRSPQLSLSSACLLFFKQVQQKNSVELVLDGDTYDDETAADTGEAVFSPLKQPSDFPEKVSIKLSRTEAEYLRRHILDSAATRNSLLAFLLKEHIQCDSFEDIPTANMPEELCSVYQKARKFSNFIYGPHMRYNVIFSEGKIESLNAEFEKWMMDFGQHGFSEDFMPDLPTYSLAYARFRTLKDFCEDFARAAANKNYEEMDRLVIQREIHVKGARAKLRKPEEYRYTGPIYNTYLDYRFSRASVILNDIFEGLEG